MRPRSSKRALPLLALLLAVGGAAFLAAQSAPPAPTCDAPEYRQFDFWIGEWEVKGPGGQVAGHNTIEPILDGCVLQESWTGNGGNVGHSFNVYDVTTGRWHQTWVDNSGTLLQLDGGLEGEKMVLEGQGMSRREPGVTVTSRITWTPKDDGSVRQHWEGSKDGGKTWTTLFDGTYRKR